MEMTLVKSLHSMNLFVRGNPTLRDTLNIVQYLTGVGCEIVCHKFMMNGYVNINNLIMERPFLGFSDVMKHM
jgi:hypothetical protein